MLKIRLSRNLRRNILRGHPWVYREALADAPADASTAQLCRVADAKGELAWAIFDPHSPIALRILSVEKAPPSPAEFAARMLEAWCLRAGVRASSTTAFRLFNGEGDRLPGLVCDVYGDLAVIQFDGRGPSEFWDRSAIAQWLPANAECATVVEKKRREKGCELIAGTARDLRETLAVENGLRFSVDVENGQKTGFFLDQRDNRAFVRAVAREQNILNLFSYTGGFSVYAGAGGAARVTTVDSSKGAIGGARTNWELNALDAAAHEGVVADAFEFLRSGAEKWDHVIVDPPSMSHSETGREAALAKYVDVFAAAIKRVRKGGMISMSSCSSHVSFEDFFMIVDESLSVAGRRGRMLRVAGQGMDHPYPHACRELRYLKFACVALE